MVWFDRDYPYTTVPNQVHRIFRAQQLHDKKHYDERISATPEARSKMEYIDYLRPIIADADTGCVFYSLRIVIVLLSSTSFYLDTVGFQL